MEWDLDNLMSPMAPKSMFHILELDQATSSTLELDKTMSLDLKGRQLESPNLGHMAAYIKLLTLELDQATS